LLWNPMHLVFTLLFSVALLSLTSICVAKQAPWWGDLANLTYGGLASVTVPPAWTVMEDLLPTITPDVLPSDVKPVRKAVLALRNALDVFSYAYPTASPSFSGDPLPYVRDLLDEGYETLGHFRDLAESGVDYDEKELVKRRGEVLEWEAIFEDKDAEHGIAAYVLSPTNNLATDRPLKDLSSFFWRDTGIVPKADDTGMQTVVKLVKAMLDLAEDGLSAVLKLNDLTHTDQQVTMHDYRKRLRAILYLGDLPLPVWQADKSTDAALTLLSDAYDAIGSVEDTVNAYVYEVDHGSKKDVEKAAKDLDKEWKDLLKWLQQNDLKTAEKTLRDALIKY